MILKVIKIGTAKEGEALSDPMSVYKKMRFLERKDRECFYILHIDAKNHLIAKELVSIGSLTNATVHPREVFKGALLNNSARIICVHNHPSGDPTPSEDDLDITDRLKQVGKIIGIPLMDHIVIGFKKYKSIEFPTI